MLTITDQMKIVVFDFHCVDNCREAIKTGAKLIKDHGGGDLPVHKYEFLSDSPNSPDSSDLHVSPDLPDSNVSSDLQVSPIQPESTWFIYGSIEKDKSATLFVSNGNALDMRSNQIFMALIDGKFMSTSNMQLELYKKYSKKYNNKQ